MLIAGRRLTWKAFVVFFFVIGLMYGVYRSMAQGSKQPSGLTLDDIRSAYDLDPLIQAGMDGSGQTVAIVAEGAVQPSDLQTFAQKYNLPTNQVEQIKVGNNPLNPASEWSLDTEIVYAIAPKATILLYEGQSVLAPATLSGSAPNVLNRILKDGRANVITMSYDACEFSLTNAQANAFDALTQKINQAGITFYKGAGDNGAYWCAKDPPSSPYASKISVGAAASDPYVTSVGGTTLSVANGQYQSEVVWSNPTKKTGTGGGLSSRWSIPDYQKPYLLTDLNPNGMRQLPDVSADADPSSGFPFYCTVDNTPCNGWSNTGGDSATGPLWAGGTALINEYLAAHAPGGTVHGPQDFYTLETAYQAGKVKLAPFHDVTQGNNFYYKALQGDDLTTGLGTPDFYAIALDLVQLHQANAG